LWPAVPPPSPPDFFSRRAFFFFSPLKVPLSRLSFELILSQFFFFWKEVQVLLPLPNFFFCPIFRRWCFLMDGQNLPVRGISATSLFLSQILLPLLPFFSSRVSVFSISFAPFILFFFSWFFPFFHSYNFFFYCSTKAIGSGTWFCDHFTCYLSSLVEGF